MRQPGVERRLVVANLCRRVCIVEQVEGLGGHGEDHKSEPTAVGVAAARSPLARDGEFPQALARKSTSGGAVGSDLKGPRGALESLPGWHRIVGTNCTPIGGQPSTRSFGRSVRQLSRVNMARGTVATVRAHRRFAWAVSIRRAAIQKERGNSAFTAARLDAGRGGVRTSFSRA